MDGFQGVCEDQIRMNIYINLHFRVCHICMRRPNITAKLCLCEYFWGRGSIAFTKFLIGSLTQKRLRTTGL